MLRRAHKPAALELPKNKKEKRKKKRTKTKKKKQNEHQEKKTLLQRFSISCDGRQSLVGWPRLWIKIKWVAGHSAGESRGHRESENAVAGRTSPIHYDLISAPTYAAACPLLAKLIAAWRARWPEPSSCKHGCELVIGIYLWMSQCIRFVILHVWVGEQQLIPWTISPNSTVKSSLASIVLLADQFPLLPTQRISLKHDKAFLYTQADKSAHGEPPIRALLSICGH